MSSSPIFVVSGGMGATGKLLADTILAQFPNAVVPVTIVSQVTTDEQIDAVVHQASLENGVLVHTLVDSSMRGRLIRQAHHLGIAEIDLAGALLELLTRRLGQSPLGQPGLFRMLREQDFKRVEAIEFTVEHDDGKRSEDLPQADIVLIGVSRVGKTPLSIYLSIMGWKVANVPLVSGIEPPPTLFTVEPRRVIGLTLDADQLAKYRRQRGRRLGIASESGYSAMDELFEELSYARRVCARGGFDIINMTGKQIEEAAQEIAERF